MTKFPQSASVVVSSTWNLGLPLSLYHCWPPFSQLVASIILQSDLFWYPLSMALQTRGCFPVCPPASPALAGEHQTRPKSLPLSQYWVCNALTFSLPPPAEALPILPGPDRGPSSFWRFSHLLLPLSLCRQNSASTLGGIWWMLLRVQCNLSFQ